MARMRRRVNPDEELMTALYNEHYAVLLSFVLRYVHDRHRAEDMVQETLLRAWKHIDHLDTDQGRTRSYLLTIARNVVTNAWRAEQRRPHLVADENAVDTMPVEDNVGLAKALIDLLADRQLARTLGEHGRQFCLATRSVEVVDARLRELYRAAGADVVIMKRP